MKKIFNLAPVLILSTVLVGCNDRYAEGLADGKAAGLSAGRSAGRLAGFNDGLEDGRADGYEDGETHGYDRGVIYFSQNTTYEHGLAAGNTAGLAAGYTRGYNAGYADGKPIGFAQAVNDGTYATYRTRGRTDGYADGYADGREDGLDDGYDDGLYDGQQSIRTAITAAYNNGYAAGDAIGYNDGYDDGYDEGYDAYFDNGYDDGFDDGYDVGYDDGWDDALGLAVGPVSAKVQSGKANLLSKVHNDLVNYSKIKAPKITARGLEVNGKLIFEESSMTSKDLEKRAASAEKYLVGQMAKQISTRFSLSKERSLQIAKVSNLWRKFATSRAVSDADAEAYTKALIGVNLKDVEKAFKDSLKGDLAPLNSLIKEAASANGTTPENVTKIMNQVFF